MKIIRTFVWPVLSFLHNNTGLNFFIHRRFILSQIWFTLILCHAAMFPALAQRGSHDSLWSDWRNTQLHDTSRLNAMLSIFRYAVDTNADSAFVYAKMGYEFAKKRKIAYYEAKFLLKMSSASTSKGDLKGSEAYLHRSMAMSDSMHNEELQSICLSNLGNIYTDRSDYASAINVYLRAASIAEKLKDKRRQCIVYTMVGNAYMNREEPDQALSYYKKSLALSEEIRDTAAIAGSLNNLGIIYREKKDLPKALQTFTRAVQLSKLFDPEFYGIGLLYTNIGDVYVKMDEFVLAADNYHNAIKILKKHGYQIGLAQTYNSIAQLYKNKFPDSTLLYARQAFDIVKDINNKHSLSTAALLLSEAYQARGQYQSALEMYKIYSQAQDSIFNEEQLNSVARSEARYEYEKKQLEDRIVFEQQLTKSRLTAQRRYFLFAGLILALLIGGSWYIYNNNVRYKADRAEYFLKISQLRETIARQSLTSSGQGEKPILNRKKVEHAISTKIGDTSWNILQLIAENPAISNREIAQKLFLSEEGISSSLRRMYESFDIKNTNSKNHKIALITKVVELSVEA